MEKGGGEGDGAGLDESYGERGGAHEHMNDNVSLSLLAINPVPYMLTRRFRSSRLSSQLTFLNARNALDQANAPTTINIVEMIATPDPEGPEGIPPKEAGDFSASS